MVNLSSEAATSLMFTLTPDASVELKRLLGAQGRDDLGLRLYIKESGGSCGDGGGGRFGMGLDVPRAGDLEYMEDGLRVILDAPSAEKLVGATVEYDAQAGGFSISKKRGGCGGGCHCGD